MNAEVRDQLRCQKTLCEKTAREKEELRAALRKAESELEALKASLIIANAKCNGLEQEVLELRTHISNSSRPKGSNGELGVQEPPRSSGSDLPAAGLASRRQLEASQEEPPRKRRAVPGTSRQAEAEIDRVAGRAVQAVDAIARDRAAAEMHPRGWGAMHLAVERGDVRTLRELLARGYDPRVQDRRGRTPLHCALDWGQREAADLLVEADSGNDIPNASGWTPLHYAAWMGWLEIVCKLVAAGARLRHQTETGRTALHHALDRGRQAAAQLLMKLDDGENNIPDDNGETPLHHAARRGYAGIVKMLLSNDLCPHVKNRFGKYPLYIAASEGHDDVVKMILAVYAWRGIVIDEGALFRPSHMYSPPLPPQRMQRCLDLLAECEAEIRRMKETRIGGSTVTYHDIATRHVSSVAVYLRNEDLRKELLGDRVAVDFPNYADLIAQKVRKAEERRALVDECL